MRVKQDVDSVAHVCSTIVISRFLSCRFRLHQLHASYISDHCMGLGRPIIVGGALWMALRREDGSGALMMLEIYPLISSSRLAAISSSTRTRKGKSGICKA